MSKQKVNYLRHHKAVMLRISGDKNLSPIDVSMYNALFLLWNASGWESELSINRSDVMGMAKVGNKNTYTDALKALDAGGYLEYKPSFNPMIGSIVTLTIFGNSEEEETITKSGNGTGKASGKASGKGGGTLPKPNNGINGSNLKTSGTDVPGGANAAAGNSESGNDPEQPGSGKKKKSPAQKKKEPGETTPHFKACAETWIAFYREKTGTEPTFWDKGGGEARASLISILTRLQKQSASAENTKGKEWTEEYALYVFKHFLTRAYADTWRAQNFRLPVLSSHYDSIVNPNGKSTSKTGQQSTGILNEDHKRDVVERLAKLTGQSGPTGS